MNSPVSLTRRSFFKLAAAATAVAVVPVYVTEVIELLPTPATPVEALKRRLWWVEEQKFTCEFAQPESMWIRAVCGTIAIEADIHVADKIDMCGRELQFDLRWADLPKRKLELWIDDKPIAALISLALHQESPLIEVTSLDQTMRSFSRGLVDEEPLEQLTAYKQLRVPR